MCSRSIANWRTSSVPTGNRRPPSVCKYAAQLVLRTCHRANFSIATFGETVRPAYRLEKLTYESEPGIAIPALLFVPNGGPARKPAVMSPTPRARPPRRPKPEQLAAKGYIVLVPDLRGFGETQPPLDRRDSFVRNFGDYGNSLTALLIGKTHGGYAPPTYSVP